MAILHQLGQTDLRRTKPGMYGDGGGLWLQITKGTAGHANRSWIFRYGRNGKRREMGLRPRSHRRPEGCPREGRSASQARL